MPAKPKVLIVGAGWMLARDFMLTQSETWDFVALDERSLDVRDSSAIGRALFEFEPEFVLNCAAYTRVDDAEDVGNKDNVDINALAVFRLAKACAEYGCGFVTISTDYVFDGMKAEGYVPQDPPSPKSAYGMAKYLGERLALETHDRSVVVRTSWLYGTDPEAKNFVNTMLRLGRTKPEIRVVGDQFGAPTFTVDLADAITKTMLDYGAHAGRILHFANETPLPEWISWYEFAKEILHTADIGTPVIPIATSEYPTKAVRPAHSRLLNDSEIRLPDWKESIQRCLTERTWK